MKNWLTTLCCSAVLFSLLEWCLSGGALKAAAKFALGILFMAIVFSGLEGLYGW